MANHRAIPRTLRQALESTFLTTTDLFGSPLNCSTTGGITYCSAFPENGNFGVVINSVHFRCTSSCIANLESIPEDMLKAVLHALASSECKEIPCLVVMILSVWDDTLWNFAAVRDHSNMSTLITIPTRHIRFVPIIGRGDLSPLPCQMAGGDRPHCQ